MATSPLLLSLSPLFSIALHSFRDSAFAQHRTLLGCLTCISDTFLAQQEAHGSDCRGQMLCLKIASAGDCYSHSRAEALVCDYQFVRTSKDTVGSGKSHPIKTSTELSPEITRASTARLALRGT